MRFYIDEENDSVYVNNTANTHSLRPSPEVGAGGTFSVVYAKDQATFLSELSDILTWRNRFVRFTDNSDNVYMAGYIRDIVNITPTSCVLIGNQAGRLLEDYPASTNTKLLEGEIKAIDALTVQDLWATPWGAFDGKLIVVEDLDKLIWKGHNDFIFYRNPTDTGTQTVDHGTALTGTTTKHTAYDDFPGYFPTESRAYGTNNTNNYIYASTDNDGAGSSNDRFYIRLPFKVPKKQGTNFTKCTVTLKLKTNHFWFFSKWDSTSYLYVLNDRTSAKTEIYDFAAHEGEWASAEQSVNDPFEALDFWNAFTADSAWGVSSMSDMFELTLDITADINFDDGDYFFNKTAYNDQGYDLYDFFLYLQVGEIKSTETDIFSSGFVVFFAGIEMEYDADNDITEGLGVIDTDTTSVLTLSAGSHSAPFPQTDGWSIGDIYTITDNLHTNLSNMFTNSNASALFTLSATATVGLADAADHRNTPLIRILDMYVQMAGYVWYERNMTIKFTNAAGLTSSGLTILPSWVDNYILDEYSYNRYGSDNYNSVRVIGKNEQEYFIDVSEPITVHAKVRLVNNPDVLVKSQARKVTENLQTFLEKDHVDFVVTLKLDSNDKRTKILIGNTIDVNFAGFATHNTLLIQKMEYWTDGTNDFAKVYLTNRTVL